MKKNLISVGGNVLNFVIVGMETLSPFLTARCKVTVIWRTPGWLYASFDYRVNGIFVTRNRDIVFFGFVLLLDPPYVIDL